MKKQSTKKLVLAALFLALAYLLPFLTGQIPEIGSMLLPMHLPVLICGFVCGGPYGLAGGHLPHRCCVPLRWECRPPSPLRWLWPLNWRLMG